LALSGDVLADRRRLKRTISFWRLAAIVIAFAGAIYLLSGSDGVALGDHVARVSVDGIILGDEALIDTIESVRDEEGAKALILSIDSPGGTTAGAEAIYQALLDVAEKKPVVATMDTLAASGGYLIALAGDRVFARGNTLTGSIGVIMQWTDYRDLFGKLGLELEEVKSAALKGEPNGYDQISPEARAMTQAMIDSSAEWFVGLVQERRKFTPEKAKELGDGSVFTGWQAKENGLIDEIGSEKEALAWLAAEKDIDESLEVIEYLPYEEDWNDWDDLVFSQNGLAGLLFRAAGLSESIAPQVEGRSVEGLVSLWRP